MATDKNEAAIEEIQKKIDALSNELGSLRDELKNMGSLSESDKTIDKKLDELAKTLKGFDNTKKLDEITKSITGFGDSLKELNNSKESAVIIKKLDDILITLAESEVVPKKLDDLQSYVAEFSGIEEKVQDLANQFDETKEIVGIIVRQLDDIERKYNIAIDKVTEAVEKLTEFVKTEAAEAKKPKESSSEPEETKPKIKVPDMANLPSAIDSLMDDLASLVTPQTEATEMAEALEEVRDELTTMIKGHTPVLFQFGKRARELKSYPPTATLNENDIASLSREIKSWTSKLKEAANES
ncbi:MAG: hypothetical protein ACFFEK_04175 [Candidatus Thorarchaeota archaeon]